jgi:hypothetical protein
MTFRPKRSTTSFRIHRLWSLSAFAKPRESVIERTRHVTWECKNAAAIKWRPARTALARRLLPPALDEPVYRLWTT